MLSERDREIQKLNGTIDQKENYIGERDRYISEQQGILDVYQKEIGELDRQLSPLYGNGVASIDVPQLAQLLKAFFENRLIRFVFTIFCKNRRGREDERD